MDKHNTIMFHKLRGFVAGKYLTSGFVVFVFAVLLSTVALPQAAFAGGGVGCPLCATEPTSLLQKAIQAGSQAVEKITSSKAVAEYTKEYVLDPAVNTAAQRLLSNAVDAIANKAKSAIVEKGGTKMPAFVRDIAEHYINQAALEAKLYGAQVMQLPLCNYFDGDPNAPIGDFKPFLSARLKNSGVENVDIFAASCKLAAIVPGGHVGAFLGGDFTQGGWSAWNTAIIQGNNQLAANTASQIELARQIQLKKHQDEMELAWGGGAKSLRDPITGKITLPGSVLTAQINAGISSSQFGTLTNADEIGEIIAAAVSRSVAKAIDGSGLFE
jgi:hypothetical protein